MTRTPRLHDQRGFALLAVTMALLVLAPIAAAGTLYVSLDLRSTAHYDTGNRAFAAAEAGVLDAMSTMNQIGAINFQSDIVNRWPQLFPNPTRTLPSIPNMGYTITLAADPTNPANRGTITATGFAPLGARRSIVVAVQKGQFTGSPGAIYLAADAVASQFAGNAFEVDGNDHSIFGDLLASGVVKPGISTRNDAVSDSVAGSLNTGQKDNVRGLGFSTNPLTPSVLPTGGPSVDDLDELVQRLLSLPGVTTTSQKNYNGNDSFGTLLTPRITHMTNSDVRLNGNASGAGILIADGSLTVNGSLDFVGWIIVRGSTVVNPKIDDLTTVSGNATILGSLWTGDLSIKVGGSAIVDYCDTCMRLVDGMDRNNGTTPRPMRAVSWQEVL